MLNSDWKQSSYKPCGDGGFTSLTSPSSLSFFNICGTSSGTFCESWNHSCQIQTKPELGDCVWGAVKYWGKQGYKHSLRRVLLLLHILCFVHLTHKWVCGLSQQSEWGTGAKAIIVFLLKWPKMPTRKEIQGVGNRIELSLGRRYPSVWT